MSKIVEIMLPDIGDFDETEIIEVIVNKGDKIAKGDSIITLESDKASMEIPSPYDGVVDFVNVKVKDKVKKGDFILKLKIDKILNNIDYNKDKFSDESFDNDLKVEDNSIEKYLTPQSNKDNFMLYASPSVRKFIRELGIESINIKGSGKKNRILMDDVKQYIKNNINEIENNTNNNILPSISMEDFTKYGEVETLPLTRINKLSSKHLSSCWSNIPHVTQFGNADITELNNFRLKQKEKGINLTILSFVMKAVVKTIKLYPKFNSVFDEKNNSLIIKKYYNIGIAVDTPNGLLVPVIKDVDKKDIGQLGQELKDISQTAKQNKISEKYLQGRCFSISNLGAFGGSQFTPIINAPDVAILGLSKAEYTPIFNGKIF